MYWFHPVINRSPNTKTTLYTGNNLYIIMVHLKLYCMILFGNRWAMISISYSQVRLVYNSILLSLLGFNIRLTLGLRLTFSFMLIKKHLDKVMNNANIAYWLVIISMCLENKVVTIFVNNFLSTIFGHLYIILTFGTSKLSINISAIKNKQLCCLYIEVNFSVGGIIST